MRLTKDEKCTLFHALDILLSDYSHYAGDPDFPEASELHAKAERLKKRLEEYVN